MIAGLASNLVGPASVLLDALTWSAAIVVLGALFGFGLCAGAWAFNKVEGERR